jgi:hypothetical protein
MIKADTFVKIFWPIFASTAAGIFALVSWHSNNLQQRYDSLNKSIDSATAEGTSPVRRIAGVWQMNQFWDDERFENTMAATLTGALIGTGAAQNDGLYRCAAAEVIGNAIVGTESYSTGSESVRSQRIARILYGDRSGQLGLVTELNRELRSVVPKQDAKTCERSTDVSALDATREAIRKNWEYLRAVNLNSTDLTGSPLYGADLDSALIRAADLHSTNFRCANLHGVDLLGSNLNDADFYLANVSDLIPASVREDLVKNRMAILLAPGQWESWRLNNFRVSKQQRPVVFRSENAADDVYPCSI